MSEIVEQYLVDETTDLNKDSRYKKLYRYILDDGTEVVETPDAISFDHSDSDIYHTVLPEQENRLDLIAYFYYNNPRLWWVILQANNISDPFVLESGTILRVPPLSKIFGYKGVLT